MNKIVSYKEYAKQINIYLYLLKFYNLQSLSKIIYSSICLNYCKSVDYSTSKRNDVFSFYIDKLKKGNAFSYENLKNAIEAMEILIESKVVKLDESKVILIKNVDYIKDTEMEKVSISIFIDEIKSLNIKSFLSEVIECV